jgi:hypothetical protein
MAKPFINRPHPSHESAGHHVDMLDAQVALLESQSSYYQALR